jgi:hypothetical protein
VLVLLLSSCSFLYGDSLTSQAIAAHAIRSDISTRATPGTALCDWWRQMAADQRQFHPTTVIVAFNGNVGTPCILNTNPTLNYEFSLRLTRAIFPTAHIIVTKPLAMDNPLGPYLGSSALDAMYRRVSASISATYCTAAADALSPGNVYRPLYRLADRVHLTDAGAVIYGRTLTACGPPAPAPPPPPPNMNMAKG